MTQYLFLGTDIQVLIDSTRRDLLDELARLTDTAILSRSNEEWLGHFIEKYTITVPTLDTNKAERTYEDAEVPQYQVPNPNFNNQSGVPGRIHTLHIPYSGPEELFYYKPSSYPMNPPVAGAWHTKDSIEGHFHSTIKVIEQNLSRLRSDVAPFNQSLAELITPKLEARRRSADVTKATTEALKYPLRKRGDAPQTYKLPVRQKALAPNPVPTLQVEQEFTLSEADYQDILSICESMSLVMERSPTVFEKAEEEHIRVHYLVQLNGQYQGAATGETFNGTGKTDILIRHRNKNIFVAECKFLGRLFAPN